MMEHKSDHTQKMKDKTQQLPHAEHGSESHGGHSHEQTPWSHDEQQYASLVNMAGNLKTLGWGVWGVLSAVGLIFVGTGLAGESTGQKMVGIGAGLVFIAAGFVVKIIWNVVSEVVKLMIDIANDLRAIRTK